MDEEINSFPSTIRLTELKKKTKNISFSYFILLQCYFTFRMCILKVGPHCILSVCLYDYLYTSKKKIIFGCEEEKNNSRKECYKIKMQKKERELIYNIEECLQRRKNVFI